jgi:hypothetical protein
MGKTRGVSARRERRLWRRFSGRKQTIRGCRRFDTAQEQRIGRASNQLQFSQHGARSGQLAGGGVPPSDARSRPRPRPGAARRIRTGLTKGSYDCPLPRTETMPLGESGGAVGFEEGSAGKAALAVEVVGDGGVDGGELLQTSHAPEPEHRPLSSSERQVGVLRPVVQPAALVDREVERNTVIRCCQRERILRDGTSRNR